MTAADLIPFIGQRVFVKYNGKYYPSSTNGILTEVTDTEITIERFEGKPLKISIKGVKEIKIIK